MMKTVWVLFLYKQEIRSLMSNFSNRWFWSLGECFLRMGWVEFYEVLNEGINLIYAQNDILLCSASKIFKNYNYF